MTLSSSIKGSIDNCIFPVFCKKFILMYVMYVVFEALEGIPKFIIPVPRFP